MGGESPARGFDCSGFVQYVFGQQHVDLPRTVGDQYRSGTSVPLARVRAGDLVFFSTVAPGASHVGLAVGADGEFIHAPSENGVVRVERLDSPYWRSRFVGARRVTRP
jgi:cell wall-associated NlpC family hydrolase